MHVLVTGGAGFIGCHVVDELLSHGHRVRVLDCLLPHVRGAASQLDPMAERIVGDVRDRMAVTEALDGVDAVIHLAAAVGTGQSMVRVGAFTSINAVGTANLLETIAGMRLRRLVVASSMCVYGEGAYENADERPRFPEARDEHLLNGGAFDPVAEDGRPLRPLPTSESAPARPMSVYASSKLHQETLCRVVGRKHGIPTVALRLFNVYGPGVALTNPHAGALANFAASYLAGRPPVLHEDGRQFRDFVYVTDAARAFRLAIERAEAIDQILNVGTGAPVTVLEAAQALGRALGLEHLQPEVSGRLRRGDARHGFADVSKARALLGFGPHVTFGRGLDRFAAWVRGTEPAAATDRLAVRGLTA